MKVLRLTPSKTLQRPLSETPSGPLQKPFRNPSGVRGFCSRNESLELRRCLAEGFLEGVFSEGGDSGRLFQGRLFLARNEPQKLPDFLLFCKHAPIRGPPFRITFCPPCPGRGKQWIHAGDSVEVVGLPRETGHFPALEKGKFPLEKMGGGGDTKR